MTSRRSKLLVRNLPADHAVPLAAGPGREGLSFRERVGKDLRRNRGLYLLILPVLLYYILFMYAPMYGAIIAFKDFSPMRGILRSSWVGFEHFIDFFKGFYFFRVFRNTLLLSLYNILFGFPAPIILALLINEVRNNLFKRTVQTITYLPHFISMVVICGLLTEFAASRGLFNDLIAYFGGARASLLQKPELFRTIFVSSEIWQRIGWGSIIYLAALAGIDPNLYEAAAIDGAGKWKQLLHITLPCLAPTIVIMLILRLGRVMVVGFEKVLLLYNPVTYQTADIISTFVYRKGVLEHSWSFGAAVGLFNSVINFGFLIAANRLSRKFSEAVLW